MQYSRGPEFGGAPPPGPFPPSHPPRLVGLPFDTATADDARPMWPPREPPDPWGAPYAANRVPPPNPQHRAPFASAAVDSFAGSPETWSTDHQFHHPAHVGLAAPTLPSDTAGPQYGLYAPSEASRPPPAPPTYRPPNPGFEGDFNLLPAAPPVRYGAFDQLKTTAVEPPLMAVTHESLNGREAAAPRRYQPPEQHPADAPQEPWHHSLPPPFHLPHGTAVPQPNTKYGSLQPELVPRYSPQQDLSRPPIHLTPEPPPDPEPPEPDEPLPVFRDLPEQRPSPGVKDLLEAVSSAARQYAAGRAPLAPPDIAPVEHAAQQPLIRPSSPESASAPHYSHRPYHGAASTATPTAPPVLPHRLPLPPFPPPPFPPPPHLHHHFHHHFHLHHQVHHSVPYPNEAAAQAPASGVLPQLQHQQHPGLQQQEPLPQHPGLQQRQPEPAQAGATPNSAEAPPGSHGSGAPAAPVPRQDRVPRWLQMHMPGQPRDDDEAASPEAGEPAPPEDDALYSPESEAA
eukprot:EG_transcript_9939